MATRVALALGREVYDERQRRGWTLERLAAKAKTSISTVHRVEAGEVASLDAYARLAVALGLEPRFTLLPEATRGSIRDADPVHAAMGEIEAEHLRAHGFEVRLDEPYQHYQFAGRADVLAIDRERRALLHLENRTRFPDIQAFVGSYNAKRAYLADDLAQRMGIERGFASVTHVVVALWSSEVLHVLRLREQSFRAVCPDAAAGFATWWAASGSSAGSGTSPRATGGARPRESSSLVLFDPLEGRRSSRRRWAGLDALRAVDPRYRGYAAALDALQAAGMA